MNDPVSKGEFSGPSSAAYASSQRYVGDGVPVGFWQAIKRGLGRSTVYGRASRSEFWYFWLFSVFLNLGSLIVIDGMLNLPNVDRGVSALISLFVTVVFIRRLHDVGRSGWWVLLSITIIGVIPLFIWSIRKGDPGPNRFGPGGTLDPAPVAVASQTTTIDDVERLYGLHLSGAITEEEYRALKRRTL